MSQYLPEVAWSTIASNVTLGASAYRYYITVNPLDPNEAGASPMTVAINDWFIDFAGYPFLIEEVNGSVLTVYDILERGDGVVSAYAPYANKLGYVYRPLNGAIILTQAQLRKLDESAKDIIQPIEKGIVWKYRGLELNDGVVNKSNITSLELSGLTLTDNTEDGWQGGSKLALDASLVGLSDVYGTPTTNGQFPSWDSGNTRFNFDKNINDYLLLETAEDSGNPTGFINNSGITVSYNYTNRQVTLTGDLSYYWKGTKKTLTSPWTSTAHTATLGSWYLYSTDGDNFTWSQTPWAFNYVMVSYVNYGASAASTFATREIHGLMDVESHAEMHSQIGTYRVSGGNATAGTYTLNTDTNAAITPGFDAAIIKDEDLSTTIPAWSQGTYSTMYVNSTTSTSTFSLTQSFPFLYTASNYINYNNAAAGTLVTGQNNRYYNVYQILIPTAADSDSQKYRTIFLQPQVEHTSLTAATGEVVSGLSLGALANISPEFVFWARLTYYSSASYTTTGKVQLAAVTYVTGSRSSQVNISGFNPSNHAALSNLQWDLSGHISTTNYAIPNFSSTGVATVISPNTSTTRKYLSMLGDGTNGALPTWEEVTGGSSQWVTSGSDIYYNTGKVYIGQTSGSYTLDVNGTFRSTGVARLGATSRIIGTNTIANTFTSALYFRDSADVGYGEVGHISSSRATVGLYGTTGVGIDLYTDGSTTPKLTIDTNGNVGIGTTSPGYGFESALSTASLGNKALIVGRSNEIWTQPQTDATTSLYINYRGYADGLTQFRDLYIANGKGTRIASFIGASGNVGIGRTPTTHKLEVEGSSLITTKLYLGTTTAPATDTGTLNSLVWDNTTGEVKQRAITGGGGTPGGSDTYVQFNDGGSFGGVNNFRFSKSVGTVTITPTNYINTGLYISTSNVPFILKGQSTNYFRHAISGSTFRIDGDGNDGFSTYKSIIVGDYAGGCDLYYNGSKKAETETYGFLITGYGKAEGFVKPYQALTSSTSVSMNVRSGQNAKITLGHNVTLTLANLVDGDEGNIVVTQDATGGRTLTISPTPKVINAGGGTLTLTGTANSIDMLSYTYANSVLYITYGTNYT